MSFDFESSVYFFEQEKIVRTGLLKYYDPFLYSDICLKTISDLNTINHVLPLVDSGSNIYPNGINAHTFDLVVPIDAYDWYVDSISGSDTNDGTTASTPFATIAKLLTVMSGSETVGLARGSEWREQITLPGAGCSIVAYGSGNKPIIRGDDICLNAGFTKTSGLTNVYQISLTVPYSVAEPSRTLAFENDISLQYRANPVLVDSNPGSYYTSASTTSAVLYIHAIDSSNIITNGKKYEASVRWGAVFGPDYMGNYQNTRLESLDMRRCYNEGGIVKLATSSSLINCDMYDGNKHLAYMGEGAYVSNCSFTDCWYDTSATMLVFNKNIATGMNNVVENSSFKLSGSSQWGATNILPINSHNNISGFFGDCYIENCSFENFVAAGVMFAMNHHNSVYLNNPFFYNSYGISGGALISGSMFVSGGSWINDLISDIRGVNVSTVQCPIIIDDFNFTTYKNQQSGIVFLNANSYLTITNSKFNNHYGTGFQRFCFYLQNCSSGSINFSNNDFSQGSQSWTYNYAFLISALGMNWTSDFNIFDAGSFGWNMFGSTFSSLSSYQSASAVSPRDANSIAI